MNTHAKQILGHISLFLVGVCVCSFPAHSQQTTYTFVGRTFDANDFYNTSCPPNCLLSGSFTVAQPLGPNIVGDIGGSGDFPTTAFQFSDGLTSFAQPTNDWGFAVDTNSSAGITNFSFYLDADIGEMYTYFDGPSELTQEGTNLLPYQAYYFGLNQNNGGGWTTKFQQSTNPWGHMRYDHMSDTIASKGCALTSLTMEANIAKGGSGATVNPGTLNTTMVNKGGYDSQHNVDWRKVAQDLNYQWVGCLGGKTGHHCVNLSNTNDLAAALQQSAQAIVLHVPSLKSKSCDVAGTKLGHFVLATGATSDGHGGYTISINDPGCAAHKTLDAFKNIFQSRGYFDNLSNTRNSQGAPKQDESTITFSGNELIEIAVLDANGRRTGFSAGGDRFDIPQSYYYRDSITDDDIGSGPTPLTHYLGINSPPAGSYTLLVTGLPGGSYSLDISGYATDGSSDPRVNVSGSVNSGQTIAYTVTYSPQPGSTPIVGPAIPASLR